WVTSSACAGSRRTRSTRPYTLGAVSSYNRAKAASSPFATPRRISARAVRAPPSAPARPPGRSGSGRTPSMMVVRSRTRTRMGPDGRRGSAAGAADPLRAERPGLEGAQDLVQRGAGPHRRGGLRLVGAVVAVEVDRVALHPDELLVDLRLVLPEGAGDRREALGQPGVLLLGGEGLGPVQREVEVAAAVVDLADPAGRGLVLLEERRDRRVQGVGEHLRLGVLEGLGQVLQRGAERGELTEGVPAQVVLLEELLDVLRRGATGTGLEEPAAGEQRDDREHLRARAELEDGEEVGQVVAQHVAG